MCTGQVAGYMVLLCCCWTNVNKKIPTHSIDNPLRAAVPHFAEIGIWTALPAPPWKRAPPLAHGQVVAVRAAGLEPCGQGCIHYAPEVPHDAAACTLTYLPQSGHSLVPFARSHDDKLFGWTGRPCFFFLFYHLGLRIVSRIFHEVLIDSKEGQLLERILCRRLAGFKGGLHCRLRKKSSGGDCTYLSLYYGVV